VHQLKLAHLDLLKRGDLSMARKRQTQKARSKIRYAVVGQGYISQVAVLPAFSNATRNSQLVALISDDPPKLQKLSKKYGVQHTYLYEQYDECLKSGEVDAVYIALPNHLHCDFTVRAAEAGVHVLCEKPMAVSVSECEQMIAAVRENGVKLMIAYRLHFEEANLRAVKVAQSGQLGDLRIFNSSFTMQVEEGNIRLKRALGGGTLFDIGIYCINAARYLFQDEPLRVFAVTESNGEKRFAEVEEMTSAILVFPHNRLACFTCSFGAADVSRYEIVGTKGSLQVDMAYEFSSAMHHTVTIGERKTLRAFPKRDQFGPELLYFSDCILEGKEPEPSGQEGMADVQIIDALYRSAENRSPVNLSEFEEVARPSPKQEIKRPPIKKPTLIGAKAPSGH
jgi:predicted dehydrogenase